MSEYMHLYEEMAAEAPSERRPAILLMGRLEISLNERLKEMSSYLEAVVNPEGWSHPGWDHFEVKVGDNHGHFICSFKFEFPHAPQNKQAWAWDRCANRATSLVLAAIKGDLEWCKDADKVRQQRRSEEDRLKREGSERDGGGKG